MKLTVKNIIKVLEKEYSECPFCHAEAEICSYFLEGEGRMIKVFCPDCGSTTDHNGHFAAILKAMEELDEDEYWNDEN